MFEHFAFSDAPTTDSHRERQPCSLFQQRTRLKHDSSTQFSASAPSAWQLTQDSTGNPTQQLLGKSPQSPHSAPLTRQNSPSSSSPHLIPASSACAGTKKQISGLKSGRCPGHASSATLMSQAFQRMFRSPLIDIKGYEKYKTVPLPQKETENDATVWTMKNIETFWDASNGRLACRCTSQNEEGTATTTS